MKFWAVIPSRFASVRFPGKPLVNIAGKPLLQRVIEQTQKVTGLNGVLVATDHDEIKKLCEQLKAHFVMTDSELPSGTDRIFQAIKRWDSSVQDQDVIINIQGDEPLIPAQWIEKILEHFKSDSNLQMLTLAHPLSEEELENLNSVKVVLNNRSEALYFSRFPIPHSRNRSGAPVSLKHIGLYAYRFSALKKFCEAPVSELEKSESLEQLRALSLGISIYVMPVEGATQGVDVPADVLKVEKLLKMGGVK